MKESPSQTSFSSALGSMNLKQIGFIYWLTVGYLAHQLPLYYIHPCPYLITFPLLYLLPYSNTSKDFVTLTVDNITINIFCGYIMNYDLLIPDICACVCACYVTILRSS